MLGVGVGVGKVIGDNRKASPRKKRLRKVLQGRDRKSTRLSSSWSRLICIIINSLLRIILLRLLTYILYITYYTITYCLLFIMYYVLFIIIFMAVEGELRHKQTNMTRSVRQQKGNANDERVRAMGRLSPRSSIYLGHPAAWRSFSICKGLSSLGTQAWHQRKS
jgi:hypothetical protein